MTGRRNDHRCYPLSPFYLGRGTPRVLPPSQATRAQITQRYYEVQLGGLVRWATQENVPFSGFGKRHMDRYLVSRAETGKAPLTLHHDAV